MKSPTSFLSSDSAVNFAQTEAQTNPYPTVSLLINLLKIIAYYRYKRLQEAPKSWVLY